MQGAEPRTVAWLAWLVLHLVTLLGGRNRVTALINLSWRYVAWNHGGGLIVGDDQGSAALRPRSRTDRTSTAEAGDFGARAGQPRPADSAGVL